MAEKKASSMEVVKVVVTVGVAQDDQNVWVRRFRDGEKLVNVPDGLVCVQAMVASRDVEGPNATVEVTFEPASSACFSWDYRCSGRGGVIPPAPSCWCSTPDLAQRLA